VTPPRAGVYRVRTAGGDTSGSFQLALGDSIAGKLISGVIGALLIGAVIYLRAGGSVRSDGVKSSVTVNFA
jgi:hypothetical protein